MRVRSLGFLCLVAGLATAPVTFAQSASFESISPDQTGCAGAICGTMNGYTVTYTGDLYAFQTSTSGDINYFTYNTPSGTYIATPSDPSGISINSSTPSPDTFSFSQPGGVTGLILDIVSLGGSGTTTTYDFNTPFTVLSCGSDNWGGGCGSTGVGYTGTTLSGDEWSGTIEFVGSPTSISFTVSDPETWSGFDPGVLTPAATPEPSSLALLGTGVLGAAGLLRRRLVRR